MSKRGNGEGSIYQMSDGRWRAAVSIGYQGGKPKRKTITAQTRTEVADRLKKVLHDQSRGLNINTDKQTTGQYLDAWLENTARPSIRPKTYRSYEQTVRNHLNKTKLSEADRVKLKLDSVAGLGAVPLSKLTLQVVQKWMNEKLKAGNSARQVSYCRTVLRIALGEAVKADLIPRNTAALAKPPRVEDREVQPFTPEEAGRFLAAAKGHRLEALFTCGIAMGLRSGEAAGLRWQDVNLEDGIITVRLAIQRQKGLGLVLVPPKSKKGRRTVELPGVCVAALRRHAELQDLERAVAGSRWIESGHVFTSGIGTPIDDRKILKEFNALVSVAKLPKQRFHDLRHLAISLLAAQGVPLKVIADIVGHSDIRLTQNVYQHVFQPAKRDAADKMDRLLTGLAENGVATSVATKPGFTPVN
jgi:integrase